LLQRDERVVGAKTGRERLRTQYRAGVNAGDVRIACGEEARSPANLNALIVDKTTWRGVCEPTFVAGW
jgi:hypothetical protein